MCICICHICVYMKPQMYTQLFSWKIETFETGFYPVIEEKGIIACHKLLNWGKINTTLYEGHLSCVYANTHIYTDSYINTPIPRIWNIHILTHLLWILYLTILYTLHLWKHFSHLIRAAGDFLLTELKWIFLRCWFYSDKMAFQDPSFRFGGYCLKSADPILLTPSLKTTSIQ